MLAQLRSRQHALPHCRKMHSYPSEFGEFWMYLQKEIRSEFDESATTAMEFETGLRIVTIT